MRKSVLKALLLQQLSQVRDVAGGEPQCVQFGQLGVRRNPGQAGFQPGESFAQHSHARPLPGVGRVSLRLARVPLVMRFGEFSLRMLRSFLHGVFFQIFFRIPIGMTAGGFVLSSLQGRCSPSVTCLIVLSITCGRAGGHVAPPVPPGRTGGDLWQQQGVKSEKYK